VAVSPPPQFLAAVALSLLIAPSQLRADSTTLEPSKDNTLYEDATGMRSNGEGARLFAGRTTVGLIRRGLLAFDVAGRIPAGSRIDAVQLSLTMDRTIVGAQTVALHRLLADWGEAGSDADDEEGIGALAAPGDATWLHRFFAVERWSQAGGDFAATASATRTVVEDGAYTWSSDTMLMEVQSWLDTPATNFGWVLIGNEATSRTAKRFHTRESSPALRPRLVVDFSPPAPSPTSSATATVGASFPTTSPTPSPSPDSVSSPTATPVPCVGDCDRSQTVTIVELVAGAGIIAGTLPLSRCSALDANGNGLPRIDELLSAVDNALVGCRASPADIEGSYDLQVASSPSGPNGAGLATARRGPTGELHIDMQLDPLTYVSVNGPLADDLTAMLNGYRVEQGDVAFDAMGTGRVGLDKDAISITGTLTSRRLGEETVTITFSMTRPTRGTARSFNGIHLLMLNHGAAPASFLSLPLDVPATGFGRCGPASETDAGDNPLARLAADGCVVSPRGLFRFVSERRPVAAADPSFLLLFGTLRETGDTSGRGVYQLGFAPQVEAQGTWSSDKR
jgi:hypothetical protein